MREPDKAVNRNDKIPGPDLIPVGTNNVNRLHGCSPLQRGFISSIYIYLIAAALITGLGYGLYKMTVKVGELNARNEQLERDKKTLSDQIVNQNKAQILAQQLKEKAEQDSVKTHRLLAQLRKEHEKLLSFVVPDGLVIGLFNAIAEANGDLPTGQPDATDKTPVPKINLGSMYQWATEDVPMTLKRCNADKIAIRSLCPESR